MRRLGIWALALALLGSPLARADEAPAPVEPAPEAAPVVEAEPLPAPLPPAAYTPAAGSEPALHIGGYLDIGAAKAGGDGTSFSPADDRLPVDYAADTFAPAVNSRGDVASTDSGGRFTNGFLPRSMGIGGHASAFVNTASLDVRYAPEGAHYLAFLRFQLLPRVNPLNVDDDRVLLQQAFVRVIPFDSQEFALTVGKFDPVFGIEYLENEANLRTGITPSLIARYTTGWETGAKAFFRYQLPSLWSAFSINAAATTNTPLVEALQPAAVSLSGRPVLSFRVGYELNHPAVQVKAGFSRASGPRTDQTSPVVDHLQQGADLRVTVGWVSFGMELVHVDMREGGDDKVGTARFVSAFLVNGGTAQLSVGIPLRGELFHKITPYVRYDRRLHGFTHFADLDTERRTYGARLDLGEMVAALKLEYLQNIERAGAANVDNDVVTSSLVLPF